MGTRTLREPTYETTDEVQAGTLMSCGQLLYMNGLIERADIDTMNSLVGRKPEYDTPIDRLSRLMFDAGFHEHAYGAFDVVKALGDFEYWRDFIGETSTDEQVVAELRETWKHWQKAGRISLRLREDYPDRMTIIPRAATLTDVDRLLADQYGVITCVEPLPNGYGIFGLVLGGNSLNGYDIYHPLQGAGSLSATELFSTGSIEISALKIPEGTTGTPITLPA